MFNGYNDAPLISYNEFDQGRETKQEDVPKWSYGRGNGVQSDTRNRCSEFGTCKPNYIGLSAASVNALAKCNCSGCYSSENSSYQDNSARHRPWLPRRFPVPLSGTSESCKLPENYQWESTGLGNQEPCLMEGKVLGPQYSHDNGGKHPHYRHYQNARLPGFHQPGIITSVKNSSPEGHVLLKQKSEISPNSAVQEMAFYGHGGTKLPAVFCNPAYDLTRNFEKRLENRSCDSNFCDLNEKYSNIDSYRHPNSVNSYPVDQHISRSPILEPYLKAVPLNLNQNRVPSAGHHQNLKENLTQSCVEPGIMRSTNVPRKMIGSEMCQTVNEGKMVNGRVVFQAPVAKDGIGSENYHSGQFHGLNSPAAMDLKNNEILIDYNHLKGNRDFYKHYDNLTEGETQTKLNFDRAKQIDYFSRNNIADANNRRNGQIYLQDGKKDCALNETNFSDQSYANCMGRSNEISNVSKYLEMANSKSSISHFYAKEFNGEKYPKSEKCDNHLQENPSFLQRNENSLKNENLNIHARLPSRPPLIFNDPRELRFVDRPQSSFPYQNNSTSCRNFVRPDYPCQGYNVSNLYEYQHQHGGGVNGFQRNDSSHQFNQRNLPQRMSNCGAVDQALLSSQNNALIFDPYCQQSENSDKVIPQQFSTGHSPSNPIETYSPMPQNRFEKSPAEITVKNPNYLETIQNQDLNRSGTSKISPLRLLRKKKFISQTKEVVNKSPVPSNFNSEAAPALDVRKFWSTWADEEEDNAAPVSQMVVLDCQNIDVEEAKLLHIYENGSVRGLNFENGGLVALKGSRSDKESTSELSRFVESGQSVKVDCDQTVSSSNGINESDSSMERQINKNQSEADQKLGAAASENSKVEPPPNERKSSTWSTGEVTAEAKENSKGNDFIKVSQEFTDEKNRVEEKIGKKLDFLKNAERVEIEVGEMTRSELGNGNFNGEFSFRGENCGHKIEIFSPEVSNNCKASDAGKIAKETNLFTETKFNELENDGDKYEEKSDRFSSFDENSMSNSQHGGHLNSPNLPTSEYRRNKFLDYSNENLITNNGIYASLESEKLTKASDNDEVPEKIIIEDVDPKKCDTFLPALKLEKIKEENPNGESLSKNNRPPLDKCTDNDELGKGESIINGFGTKPETGFNRNFEASDALVNVERGINFLRSEEIENEAFDKSKIEIQSNGLVDANNVKKREKFEIDQKVNGGKEEEEEDEDDDEEEEEGEKEDPKGTLENISVSKPTIKFSIQKSHDLKISFKVLNGRGGNNNRGEFEIEEDEIENNEEGKSLEGSKKNSTIDLVTLKLKSIQNEDWGKINSRTGVENGNKKKKKKNNREKLRRKKIYGGSSPLKNPVLKIKKKRKYFMLEGEEKDPLANADEEQNQDRDFPSRKFHNSFESNNFQVEESIIDSAKIKLTFKRHKSNFETDFKESGDEEEDEEEVDSFDSKSENSRNGLLPEAEGNLSPRKKSRLTPDIGFLPSEADIESDKSEVEFRERNFVPTDFDSDSNENQQGFVPEDFPISFSTQFFNGESDQNCEIDEEKMIADSEFPLESQLKFYSSPTGPIEAKNEVEVEKETSNFENEKSNSEKLSEGKEEEDELEVGYGFINEVFNNSKFVTDAEFNKGNANSNEFNNEMNCDKDDGLNNDKFDNSVSEIPIESEILESEVNDPLKETPVGVEKESESNFNIVQTDEEQITLDQNRNVETVGNLKLKTNHKSSKNQKEDFSMLTIQQENDHTVDHSQGNAKPSSSDSEVGKISQEIFVNEKELSPRGETDGKIVKSVDVDGSSNSESNAYLDLEKSHSVENISVSDCLFGKTEEEKSTEEFTEGNAIDEECKNENVNSSEWNKSSEVAENAFDRETTPNKIFRIDSINEEANAEENKSENSDVNSIKSSKNEPVETEKIISSTTANDTKMYEISEALKIIFQDSECECTNEKNVELPAAESNETKSTENFINNEKVFIKPEVITDISMKGNESSTEDINLTSSNTDGNISCPSNFKDGEPVSPSLTDSNASLPEKCSLAKQIVQILEDKNQEKNVESDKLDTFNKYNGQSCSSANSNKDRLEEKGEGENVSKSENDICEKNVNENVEVDAKESALNSNADLQKETFQESVNSIEKNSTEIEGVTSSLSDEEKRITTVTVTTESAAEEADDCQDQSSDKRDEKEIRKNNADEMSSGLQKSFVGGILEKFKNPRKKITRRHSLSAEDWGEAKSKKLCKFQNEIHVSKVKFTYSKWKSHYLKSKSCPPSIKSSNQCSIQMEIPTLDIPVEDIPIPMGDPPPENCFDLVEYLKMQKISAEDENAEKNFSQFPAKNPRTRNKLPEINLSASEQSLISQVNEKEKRKKIFEKPNQIESMEKEEVSNKIFPAKNCRSPFTSNDLENCCNSSPARNRIMNKINGEVDRTIQVPSNDAGQGGISTKKTENESGFCDVKISEETKENTSLESDLNACLESNCNRGDRFSIDGKPEKPCDVESKSNEEKINSPQRLSVIGDIKIVGEVTKQEGDFAEEEKMDAFEDDSSNFENINDATPNESGFFENSRQFEEQDLELDHEETRLEESETNELEKLDCADGESTTIETCFENDIYMRDGFYECEDIPTSEDLPSGEDNIEGEKVSDDKFRHMMQNCLDNAKKFLNVSNLKLFSCSMEDLLELDCRLTEGTREEEKESDKSPEDSTNQKDVLLASRENVVLNDLELPRKFPPADLSVDFVPSFDSEASSNLCSEILPVDNWPYLEEEVPSSPMNGNVEESVLIPFPENLNDSSIVHRVSPYGKPESKNGIKKIIGKKYISRPGVNEFKRFRRRSLMTEEETSLVNSSKINGRRRKTMDFLTREHAPNRQQMAKELNDFETDVTRLKNGLEKMEHLWRSNKDLKSRLSLEKLESIDQKNKYKAKESEPRPRGNRSDGKDEKNEKTSIEISKHSKICESLKQNFSDSGELRKIHPDYKSSMWQPKVMLFRISKKQMKRVEEQNFSKSRSESKDEKRNFYSIGNEDSLERISGRISENSEFEDLSSSFALKRSKSGSKLCEKSEAGVKSRSQNDTMEIKNRDDKQREEMDSGKIHFKMGFDSGEKIKKQKFSHGNSLSSAEMDSELHEKLSNSNGGQFHLGISSRGSYPMSRKKSRFRNLHSRKKIKSDSSAKGHIPRDSDRDSSSRKSTLIDEKRVLNEILNDGHQPSSREQVFKYQITCTKDISHGVSSRNDENVKEITELFKNGEIPSPLHHKRGNFAPSEKNESNKGDKKCGKSHESHGRKSSDESSRHRKSEEICKESKKHSNEKARCKNETRRKGRETLTDSSDPKAEVHRKERNFLERDKNGKKLSESSKSDSGSDCGVISQGMTSNREKSIKQQSQSKNSKTEVKSSSKETKSPERNWICEVCGYDKATERISHIKDHPFHCQSCHLAFRTEARFVNHLTRKHKDIRNQHHCLLCELSFDTEMAYQRHLETREHRHLETVEKNTINTLFTLLTGQPCPVLGLVEMKPEWLPNQAGTVHFYHQATPLSLALQYLKMHHDLSSYSKESSSHPN